MQQWPIILRSYFLSLKLRKNKNLNLAHVCLLSSKPATAFFFLSQPQQLCLIKNTLPANTAAHPEWVMVAIHIWMVPNPEGLTCVPGQPVPRWWTFVSPKGRSGCGGHRGCCSLRCPGQQTHGTGLLPFHGAQPPSFHHTSPFPS